MTVNDLAPRRVVMVALGATTHAFTIGTNGTSTAPHLWTHT